MNDDIAGLQAVIAEALDAFPDLSEEWPLEVKRHLILLLNQTPSDAVERAKADAWDECVQAFAWAQDNGPDPLRYVADNNPHRTAAIRAEGEEK